MAPIFWESYLVYVALCGPVDAIPGVGANGRQDSKENNKVIFQTWRFISPEGLPFVTASHGGPISTGGLPSVAP